MRCINEVELLGSLGADPEIRSTPSGTTVANLRLATNERRKNGDSWEDHTEWHRVIAFGRTAEVAEKYLSKGSPLIIKGRLQTRKWQDKDGNDRYSTEVVVNDLYLLPSGKDGGGRQPARSRDNWESPPNKGERSRAAPAQADGFNDDIPF